jgi:Holliday junction resolvasome RuvABC ATP-dependent DNA helicase subunit
MSIFEFSKPSPANAPVSKPSPAKEPVTVPPDHPAKRRLLEVHGFSELVGQAECIRRLKAFGALYASQNGVPEHILLIGADGMGKATIARAFAKSYNTGLREHSAREFKKCGDLTALLTSADGNDALLISDIQDLRRNDIAGILRLAMQEFRINLIRNGLHERVHPYQTCQFALITLAEHLSDIHPDLIRCFSLSLSLQPYTTLELESIAHKLAGSNRLKLREGVPHLVASVAQGNPGMVEQLIRRLSRLGKSDITEAETIQVLSAFGLNPHLATSAGAPMAAGDLEKLTGVEFEKTITAMLQRMGFQAEMTRVTGDGGIDIVAHLEQPFVGGRYLVQCKRFAPDVLIGAPTVREFYGAFVADRKAIKGIFITTSAFTAQAYEFAESLPLELIDGTRLKQLLTEQQVGLPAGEIHPRALFS